jgi:hypothetical protein
VVGFNRGLVRGYFWSRQALGTELGMATGRDSLDSDDRHNPQLANHSSLTHTHKASETSREPDSGRFIPAVFI